MTDMHPIYLENEGLKKERNYRPADCCGNCKFHDTSYFVDMSACKKLNWSYGDDVYPTHICDLFERIEKE